LYEENLSRFMKEPAAAKAFLTVGLPGNPEGDRLADLAAWMVISNVLLNLDETLTKG
jgi:hypothetical protein